jgi:flagellar biosynthesis protein FliQ
MTEFTLLQLVKETLLLAFTLSAPLLLIGMLVGVIISIIQTATSIQDQSLSFIPKLMATIATVIALGPWMLSQLMQFCYKLLGGLQQFAR